MIYMICMQYIYILDMYIYIYDIYDMYIYMICIYMCDI